MKVRISPLDKLFSEYIRRRAKGVCERCGIYKGFSGLQCCHYHSRRKRSTRYDPDNALALDFGCHQYFHENPDEFKEFMRRRLGERELDLLDSRSRVTWPRPDEALIELWLNAEISKLEGEWFTLTEKIEAKRQQVKADRFKMARRVLDCLEFSKDRNKCLTCPDRAICRRLEDAGGP